jgi:hypothetical protein
MTVATFLGQFMATKPLTRAFDRAPSSKEGSRTFYGMDEGVSG